MADGSGRRSYTDEQRKAVLQDVRKLGVCGAATKNKVPQSCVSRWAAAAGVKRETDEVLDAPAKGRRRAAPKARAKPTEGEAVTPAIAPAAAP